MAVCTEYDGYNDGVLGCPRRMRHREDGAAWSRCAIPCHRRLKLLRLGSDDAHAQSLKPNPCAIETPICDTPYLRHHMLMLPLNIGKSVGIRLYLLPACGSVEKRGDRYSFWKATPQEAMHDHVISLSAVETKTTPLSTATLLLTQ
jgi:hypothetical protein